jgi:multidrug efflux system membrane fusion protein
VAQVNAAFAKGPLPVEALAADNESAIDRGTLQVVDNQVDPTTGTVKLKAEFPNASLQLWSGQFVNVRMLIDTRKQVVVVPTAAVQRGPDGPFVFAVQGGKVAVRPVTVAQQDDVQAVISTGVQTGDQIVTTGFAQLADGTSVQVTEGGGTPQPRPARPAGGRRQNRPATPEDAGTAANPPAGVTRPAPQQRSSTGAAASPAP